MKAQVARIIDANANRAREGLRVIEEVARMLWDDAELTENIKGKRHKITELVRTLPISSQELLAARESSRDVGQPTRIKSEQKRENIDNLLTSNFKRAEEALRVLEEFTKLADEKCAEGFKQLRFQLYSLEKEMITKDK